MEEIVEKEGNAKGEGFMSSLAFITVKAKVKGEDKTYEWVVKSTPREANRYSPASSSLFQPSVTQPGQTCRRTWQVMKGKLVSIQL